MVLSKCVFLSPTKCYIVSLSFRCIGTSNVYLNVALSFVISFRPTLFSDIHLPMDWWFWNGYNFINQTIYMKLCYHVLMFLLLRIMFWCTLINDMLILSINLTNMTLKPWIVSSMLFSICRVLPLVPTNGVQFNINHTVHSIIPNRLI